MSDATKPDNALAIERAREQYQEDGAIEIDNDAEVSWDEEAVPSRHAYVQAWVLVEFDREEP